MTSGQPLATLGISGLVWVPTPCTRVSQDHRTTEAKSQPTRRGGDAAFCFLPRLARLGSDQSSIFARYQPDQVACAIALCLAVLKSFIASFVARGARRTKQRRRQECRLPRLAFSWPLLGPSHFQSAWPKIISILTTYQPYRRSGDTAFVCFATSGSFWPLLWPTQR